MRVVIVGASRFGTSTAQELLANGHEVVLVDEKPERLKAAREHLDCGMVEGDGSLPTVQRDAFGDHADALVLLTNMDDVNILAAVVGRSVGFPRVVPQIVRPELLSVCEELGLTDLITPHAMVARSIVRVVEGGADAALDLRHFKGVQVLGYRIGKRCHGWTASDFELPEQARIIGLARGEEGEDFVFDIEELREGDRLILVASPKAHAKLDALFAEPPEPARNDKDPD
ncbi:NAD-binding protein [Salipiger sp. P9]|uniref:potassium channel family protein n=1 Tax=Salipiger pentaromativorans TaxID=2943193 RepID=UPI0021587A07|nr:NAD-binding protein [Salipiger pentaromativorans]MCR8549479.1 NAD-binding protein [Salipiger pentaromativorans]